MCGIAGFCDFSRDNRTAEWGEVAWRMGETLARRGPDDDGVWQTRQCALAHRRLAVIDPAHGAQPMVRTLEGGQCAICYNGELYNTPELRRELEALGVEILTCGTCLNHYGIADKLRVGQVTNMYVIAEKQMNATLVIRP